MIFWLAYCVMTFFRHMFKCIFKEYLNRIDVWCFNDILLHFKSYIQILRKMKRKVGILLYCLFLYVRGKQSTQQKKLESLKSLIFNNAELTVTLNSTDLKQLLSLSTPTLGKGMYCCFYSQSYLMKIMAFKCFDKINRKMNLNVMFIFSKHCVFRPEDWFLCLSQIQHELRE